MKKSLSLFVLAFLAVLGVQAQMIAYSVSANVVGEPGEPTVVDLQGTTGADLSGIVFDADGNIEFNSADNLTGFPIGFEFRYNSQRMTHFLIGGDLEIQLSPTEQISTDVHKNNSNWFTTNGIHDVIGITTRQGVYGLDDTQISYWTEGTEGYRALVIEYKNIDFQGTYNADNDYCGAKATVQYRLYEKTGNIEIKVSGFKPVSTGTYNFMRIGILGDSKDFVQVQSWDGSVVSASDGSISYSADSYPVDGTVYTFQAPEPCATPTAAPTDLVLTSTTTQISGTFTATQGDHFLVLATTDAALSEQPAAGKKYVVGDAIGNARVIANVDKGEFASPNNIEQGTWNIFVIAYNSLCMDGPLYGANAAQAAIAMKPAAPESIAVTEAERTSIKLTAKSSGTDFIVAMTGEQYVNYVGQYLTYGVFGEPTGTYQVGDEIEGGGKVIYVGSDVENFELTDLESGKPYFLRAWSSDGQGGYSSEYVETNVVTAADVPWTFDLDTAPTGDVPIGWIEHEDDVWSMNQRSGYFYNQVNFVPEGEFVEAWRESSDIYLGEGSNWLSVELSATEIPVRFASSWTMQEGEVVAIQVTTDGVEYKDIVRITKDNMPGVTTDDDGNEAGIWNVNEFYPFKVNFSDYAGQKVRLRLYIKRATKGQVQFKDLKIDGMLYGIVGTIPGLSWDEDLFMTQSADDKNLYEATLNVTIDAVPAEAYEYKMRTNQNWDGYQLPASGNQSWLPTEAGDYALKFVADVAANRLTLWVERPYEVSFANEAMWTNVYAYTFTYDPETNVITEPSGPWPGTKVEVSGGWFSRSWTYNFTAEQQPQYIIWNNGGGIEDYEEAAQTDDLPFVNGKKYSVYPDITSVKISGSWNGWNGPEMTVTEYNDKAFQTTVNLTAYTDAQEFKLVVNGQWIGSGELYGIEGDAASSVTEGEAGSNLKLAGGKAYDIVAFWAEPSATVKSGWLLEIVENTSVGINGIRANAPKQNVYNLGGQRLQEEQRGVNIVGGKKVVVK